MAVPELSIFHFPSNAIDVTASFAEQQDENVVSIKAQRSIVTIYVPNKEMRTK
jgi:hypothetical protein